MQTMLKRIHRRMSRFRRPSEKTSVRPEKNGHTSCYDTPFSNRSLSQQSSCSYEVRKVNDQYIGPPALLCSPQKTSISGLPISGQAKANKTSEYASCAPIVVNEDYEDVGTYKTDEFSVRYFRKPSLVTLPSRHVGHDTSFPREEHMLPSVSFQDSTEKPNLPVCTSTLIRRPTPLPRRRRRRDPQAIAESVNRTPISSTGASDQGNRTSELYDHIKSLFDKYSEHLGGVFPIEQRARLLVYADCDSERCNEREKELQALVSETSWTVRLQPNDILPKLRMFPFSGENHRQSEYDGDGLYKVVLETWDAGSTNPDSNNNTRTKHWRILSQSRLSLVLSCKSAFKMLGFPNNLVYFGLTVTHLLFDLPCAPNHKNSDRVTVLINTLREHPVKEIRQNLIRELIDLVNDMITNDKIRISLQQQNSDHAILVHRLAAACFDQKYLADLPEELLTDSLLFELDTDGVRRAIGERNPTIMNSISLIDGGWQLLNGIADVSNKHDLQEYLNNNNIQRRFCVDNIVLTVPRNQPMTNNLKTALWATTNGSICEGYSGAMLRVQTCGSGVWEGIALLHGCQECPDDDTTWKFFIFSVLKPQIQYLQSHQSGQSSFMEGTLKPLVVECAVSCPENLAITNGDVSVDGDSGNFTMAVTGEHSPTLADYINEVSISG